MNILYNTLEDQNVSMTILNGYKYLVVPLIDTAYLSVAPEFNPGFLWGSC